LNNYIYHYTTIETLELIFSNKTLRLNHLSNVDDMEEGQVNSFGDMSKYVFVSSWTKDHLENIPLWKMYTPNMSGIRIKINSSKIVLSKNKDNSVTNIDSDEQILAFQNNNFLENVEYLDNPKVDLFDDEGSITRKVIAELGKRKHKAWEFQNEVRFILMGLPINAIDCFGGILKTETAFYECIIQKFNSNISFIDLKINNDIWDDSEILLGPNTNFEDETKVNSLISNFYPKSNINVTKSSLKIRTKNM